MMNIMMGKGGVMMIRISWWFGDVVFGGIDLWLGGKSCLWLFCLVGFCNVSGGCCC